MLRYLYVSFSFFFLFWPQAFTGGPENYIFIKFELFEFLNLSLDHVLLKLSIHSSASPRLKLIIHGSAAPRSLTWSLKLHKTLLISDLWLEQSLKWEKKVSVWLKSNDPGTVQNLRLTFHSSRELSFSSVFVTACQNLATLGLTTDLHYDLGKWKFLSRNVKFAFNFFCPGQLLSSHTVLLFSLVK